MVKYLLRQLQHDHYLVSGEIFTKATSVGRAPPHIAARWGLKEVVRVLLDRGTDPLKEDMLGRTAVSVAQTIEIE